MWTSSGGGWFHKKLAGCRIDNWVPLSEIAGSHTKRIGACVVSHTLRLALSTHAECSIHDRFHLTFVYIYTPLILLRLRYLERHVPR